MAAVKSNCLYIFKTSYLEGCYTDTFSIYTYIGVDILNILLLDLDQYSHPPFLKTAAVLINVAISLSNMAHKVLIFVSMYRYMDSDFKFVKHFIPDLAYIFFKQFIWKDVIWTVLSKYTYVGVAILNILLFDLDRHLHSPFSKLVALKANVAISCELYHLESISKLHVQRKWC